MITFQVTEKHISQARSLCSDSFHERMNCCPIALALSEVFNTVVEVDSEYIQIGDTLHLHTPESLAYMEKFDEDKEPVYPCELSIFEVLNDD